MMSEKNLFLLTLASFRDSLQGESRPKPEYLKGPRPSLCQKYEYLGEVLQQVDHWSGKISKARKCESAILLVPPDRRHLAVNFSNFPSAEKLS